MTRWLMSRGSSVRSSGIHLRFPLQQRALALDAPAITGKRAVGAHDAVTRNGDGNSIRGAGPRHRAYRGRAADPFGDLAVARGSPGGDVAERLPDALLERGAAHIERQFDF